MRIATIDIGSYSVRLSIGEIKDSKIKIIYEKGVITGLGKGVTSNGILDKKAVEETIEVLKEYKNTINEHGADKVIAVATEALRRAKNAKEFINKVKETTGIDIKVITPDEEGKLSYKAVCYSLKLSRRIVVVDQGGGSTEFIYGKSCDIEKVISLPVGIVNLTERFVKHDPPLKEELKSMKEFIDNNLKKLEFEVDNIVGLGGTITTLSALEYNIYPYDPSKIHGSILKRESIKKWLNKLANMKISERKKIPQIEDRRAEAIVSGILMFDRILDHFKKDEIIVSDWGLKHGLMVSVI